MFFATVDRPQSEFLKKKKNYTENIFAPVDRPQGEIFKVKNDLC